MNFAKVPQYVWTNSPKELWSRLRRGRSQPAPIPAWKQGKHAQWGRLVYYLDLFRRLCGKHGHELELGKGHVLEIGAGPVLGFGPLALAEGAQSYTVVDPAYQELRNNEGFYEDFLYPLFCMYATSHSPDADLSFDDFKERVRGAQAHAAPIEDCDLEPNKFRLIISKSCLEHIRDLSTAAERCHAVSSEGSLHVHYVDFSMHQKVDRIGSPFGKTYSQSRESNPEYFGNVRGLVNLLRCNDVISIFEKRFRQVHFHPLLNLSGRMSFDDVHPDWRGYSAEDLAVVNGVLIAVK